jgi:hypothetical protein
MFQDKQEIPAEVEVQSEPQPEVEAQPTETQ